MKYGYFDDASREYVITNPKTPVKWINYIGTLAFGGFVDHTGGALLCKGDPSYNRITRYIAQLPSSEFKGETLYVRLKEDTGYKVFSPFFVPTLDKHDRFECRVGLGYSRIISEYYGVRAEVTIFVPPDDGVEIRDIVITNISKTPRSIDIIPVVEYSHFDALKQFTNADWVPQTMQSVCVDDGGGRKILLQYAFMKRDTAVNYFTSNAAVSSFETSRPVFLGDNEYGRWGRPLSLEKDELSNYEARRGDNIGALMHHCEKVQPNACVRIITMLGQEAGIDGIKEKTARYCDPKNVENAFDQLRKFWDGYLSRLSVATPDKDMNRMLNIYNPRQCYITFNWSRYLSLYQLGYGNRELGYRDSSQDVMGVMDRIADKGRELIIKLLQVQKANGSAMHQFNPLTMKGGEGDSLERPDMPHYYSDDHLWTVLAVGSYIKETGNIAFLHETVPYYEKGPSGKPIEQGTVWDHMLRALEFTRKDRGAHGLPRLGFADWNDSVNLKIGAESLFTACLYGKALLEVIECARSMNDLSAIKTYADYYAEMKLAFNEHAWDGAWYVRYFDHDGSPLGSHRNTHGKIYINSQSWSVISGFATPQRAISALESVHTMLNTSKGIKLSMPGFNGFDPSKGGITTYPPGAKENGGIFLHTNPWVMIAEAMVGNGDRAYEYYRQINPAAKNDIIDEFECEPYVYPQNILGDEHPQFGLARNSWLSGTSSWAYQAATQSILGIAPTYRGLRIDPCIPSEWKEYRVKRVFRNSTYSIHISNPLHKSKGAVALEVDGIKIEGNMVPAFANGKDHKVEAVIQ
jgi:cellobiose phosphorylase